MRVVVKATGLQADTIRKWQSRHQAVEPARTQGRSRRFRARDIRRLQLLKTLTEAGHAIGALARLTDEELARLVHGETASLEENLEKPAPDGETRFASLVRDYLAAIERYDLRPAAELLTRAAAMLPPDELALQLAAPLLREVGLRWSRGKASVAHEHLVSAQLRGVLSLSLHLRASLPGARKLLVATPEGHRHEFGALIGALLASARGLVPIYLGPDVPEPDLREAVDGTRPAALLLSVVRDLSPAELHRLVATLARLASRLPVWLGLPAGHALARARPSARLFHSYLEFDLALTQLASSDRPPA
jgi:DNA-binding transcriptional MerR regulator